MCIVQIEELFYTVVQGIPSKSLNLCEKFAVGKIEARYQFLLRLP